MLFSKRGQLTLFLIIAAVIVVGIVAFFLIPRLNVDSNNELNPSNYLRECLEPKLQESLEILSKQGGYLEPTNYMLYQDQKIQYLCYTSDYYVPCVVQQATLVDHVKKEIKNYVQPSAQSCMQQLKEMYEQQGYQVTAPQGEINVELNPSRISILFASPFSATREGSETFTQFSVSMESRFYDLLTVATHIIQMSSTLGDSETLLYVEYYPDLIIEKIKKDEGTIYRLENVVSGDKFDFATRSLIWPSGYGA